MELFVALRYLRGKKKMGFISLITYVSMAGVLLGTLVLIVALAVANGFEKEVRDRIVGTLADAKVLHYHSKPFENYEDVRTTVLKNPHVIAAAPYIMGKGALEDDGSQEGVMIVGIDDSLEVGVTNISRVIKYGEFSVDSARSYRGRDLPGILIGSGMSDKMGAREGSEVVLMSLVQVEGESEPVPKMLRFVVRGVFETGMYEYDLNLVYVSLRSAQRLFAINGVEGIKFKVDDLFRAAEISKEVCDSLGGYPFKHLDWQSQNRSLFQWMKLEKLIIFIVISLIMVVAAFNIVSSLVMMILEKRREIGILMSMGADSFSIMKIFMINGILTGLIGSVTGTTIGLVLCFVQIHWQFIKLPGDIYFIDTLPVLLEWKDVLIIFLSANVISVLAAAYPAWKASKLMPAEAIRFE